MKKILTSIFSFLIVIIIQLCFVQTVEAQNVDSLLNSKKITIVFPVNGQQAVARQPLIIIHSVDPIDSTSIIWQKPDTNFSVRPTVWLISRRDSTSGLTDSTLYSIAPNGRYKLSSDRRTLTFIPAFLLEEMGYTIIVSGLKATNALGTSYDLPETRSHFTTIELPVRILGFSPDQGAAVDPMATLSVEFSKPLTSTAAPKGAIISLFEDSYSSSAVSAEYYDSTGTTPNDTVNFRSLTIRTPVPATLSLSADNRTVFVTPVRPLDAGKNYELKVYTSFLTGDERNDYTIPFSTPSQYSLSVMAFPEEAVHYIDSSVYWYSYNESTTLYSAVAAEGYRFKEWRIARATPGGVTTNIQTAERINLNVNAMRITATAVYEQIPTVDLAIATTEHGSVTVYTERGVSIPRTNGVYRVYDGTAVVIVARPEAGFYLDRWESANTLINGTRNPVLSRRIYVGDDAIDIEPIFRRPPTTMSMVTLRAILKSVDSVYSVDTLQFNVTPPWKYVTVQSGGSATIVASVPDKWYEIAYWEDLDGRHSPQSPDEKITKKYIRDNMTQDEVVTFFIKPKLDTFILDDSQLPFGCSVDRDQNTPQIAGYSNRWQYTIHNINSHSPNPAYGNITVTAHAGTGYKFLGWNTQRGYDYEGGKQSDSVNTLTMNGLRKVQPLFAEDFRIDSIVFKDRHDGGGDIVCRASNNQIASLPFPQSNIEVDALNGPQIVVYYSQPVDVGSVQYKEASGLVMNFIIQEVGQHRPEKPGLDRYFYWDGSWSNNNRTYTIDLNKGDYWINGQRSKMLKSSSAHIIIQGGVKGIKSITGAQLLNPGVYGFTTEDPDIKVHLYDIRIGYDRDPDSFLWGKNLGDIYNGWITVLDRRRNDKDTISKTEHGKLPSTDYINMDDDETHSFDVDLSLFRSVHDRDYVSLGLLCADEDGGVILSKIGETLDSVGSFVSSYGKADSNKTVEYIGKAVQLIGKIVHSWSDNPDDYVGERQSPFWGKADWWGAGQRRTEWGTNGFRMSYEIKLE